MTFLTNWGPKPMGTPSPFPDLRLGGKKMRAHPVLDAKLSS